MKTFPKEKAMNINPSCLNVERATSFFASTSTSAIRLAIINVASPRRRLNVYKTGVLLANRIKIQIPAVTRVELCTKALTGVGAAIAAGSQLVKGHCALLVMRRRKNLTRSNPPVNLSIGLEIRHAQYAKHNRRMPSPMRFVNNVKSPPLVLIQF